VVLAIGGTGDVNQWLLQQPCRADGKE